MTEQNLKPTLKTGTEVIAEYKDEGFAIFEDSAGKFVAFRDREDIVSVDDNLAIDYFRQLTLPVSRENILT